MAAGTTHALILQNFTHDAYFNVRPSPVQVIDYTRPTEILQHYGAEATRPADCHFGDARAVFDAESGLFFFDVVGKPAAAFDADSYCIGIGGQSPSSTWTWNRIYWTGHAGDGARIAVLHDTVMLIGVGDVLRCDKYAMIHGLPNVPGTTLPACAWQPTGPMDGAIPAVIKNGVSTVGYFVGLSNSHDPQHPGQLQIGYTDGTPLQPVLYGDLSAHLAQTTVHAPGDVEPLQFQLRNAVYDLRSDLLWIAFNGQCLVSGNHACMGALEIILHPYPILWATYYFDEPFNVLDASLGGLTVDHAGYPMFTWVASSATLGDSMAVGGFQPDAAGTHTLSAYGYYRITHAGDGGSYSHPDYVECDTIPGTNQVIAHGLHNQAYQTANYGNPIGYRFVSDVDTFNHCCNPRTGCPRSGCP